MSVDVASVVMQASPDPALQTRYTTQARDWLDVGSSKPEAERSRLRWARFTVTELEQLTYSRRRRNPYNRLQRQGKLSLHGFKMDSSAALRAVFHYAGSETPDARPTRLVIQSLRPLVVSLKAHAIEPRDSAGVLIAHDIKLLGSKVGHEARVSLDLVAHPQ